MATVFVLWPYKSSSRKHGLHLHRSTTDTFYTTTQYYEKKHDKFRLFATSRAGTPHRSHWLVWWRIRLNSNCLRHKWIILTRVPVTRHIGIVFTIAGGWRQLNIVISCFSVNTACRGNSATSATFNLSRHITATGCGKRKFDNDMARSPRVHAAGT